MNIEDCKDKLFNALVLLNHGDSMEFESMTLYRLENKYLMLDKNVLPKQEYRLYEWSKSSQAIINALTEQDIKEWSLRVW